MVGRIVSLLLVACAIVDARIAPLIIGGRDSESIYPYQVSIRVNGKHRCGGSLLNHHWVLTAAHCLYGMEVANSAVVLATNSIYSGGTAYHVVRWVIHPDYNPSLYRDDIALVEVLENIQYTMEIAPVNLPTEDVDESDCTAVFTGWGSIEVPGSVYQTLQEIDLKVLDWSQCRRMNPSVHTTNLCTLTVYGEGLCYGDSGGPLVANGVQIGICSRGTPCARGFPDIYTRVYSYVNWIKSHIK